MLPVQWRARFILVELADSPVSPMEWPCDLLAYPVECECDLHHWLSTQNVVVPKALRMILKEMAARKQHEIFDGLAVFGESKG